MGTRRSNKYAPKVTITLCNGDRFEIWPDRCIYGYDADENSIMDIPLFVFEAREMIFATDEIDKWMSRS